MRERLSYRITCLLFIVIGMAFLTLPFSLAQEPRFILRGEVRLDLGFPLHGVEVILRGSDLTQRTRTDFEGKFAFEVPAGTYELVFRDPDYLETVLRGVEVKKQPLEELKVLLTKLRFERDLEIIGPREVPAPALEISFNPELPLKVGRPMQGTLILKNVGRRPILIPTEPYTKDEQYSPQAKIMQISVHVNGYYDYYEEKYICLPSSNCKELAPFETISFPIRIYKRREYDEGKRVVQVYPKKAEYRLQVSLHFWLPHEKGSRPIVTEPLRREFRVLICEGSQNSIR